MAEKKVPLLCGGTFFILLTKAKLSWGSNRQIRDRAIREAVENRKHAGDNNAQPDMLSALIQMVDPDFRRNKAIKSFDVETTEFKCCQRSYSSNIPFDQDYLIADFDSCIKGCYGRKLEEMHSFVLTRLNTGPDKSKTQRGIQWLVQAVLTLLEQDETINADAQFYALESGRPISKKELLDLDDYCVDSLLLGIWHYIVVERPLDNEDGRATFEAWHRKPDDDSWGAPWKFISPIGNTYPKEITLYFYGDREVKAEEEEATAGTDDERDTEEPELVEAEIVDDAEDVNEEEHKAPTSGQSMTFTNNGDGDMFCFIGTYNDYRKG